MADVEVDMEHDEPSEVEALRAELRVKQAELDDLRTRADAARAIWNGVAPSTS